MWHDRQTRPEASKCLVSTAGHLCPREGSAPGVPYRGLPHSWLWEPRSPAEDPTSVRADLKAWGHPPWEQVVVRAAGCRRGPCDPLAGSRHQDSLDAAGLGPPLATSGSHCRAAAREGRGPRPGGRGVGQWEQALGSPGETSREVTPGGRETEGRRERVRERDFGHSLLCVHSKKRRPPRAGLLLSWESVGTWPVPQVQGSGGASEKGVF